MTDRVTMLFPGRRLGRRVSYLLLAAACASLGLTPGCGTLNRQVDAPPPAEPGATFSGDAYLRGTVQSYGQLVNNLPLLVSGYGMVVDLNGTGSNEVPAFLREWLMTEMRRHNVGSAQFGTDNLSPQRALSDTGSSVVAVEGFIPPGAVPGTKFDLLVTMVDQNSTSLSGGRLFWPTHLTEGGLRSQLVYTKTFATGYGLMYVNPIGDGEESREFLRQALVVDGGTVVEPRQVQMVLNQKSYLRTRQIADRVNERFPAGQSDLLPTAVAKSDLVVEFNIPERFAGDPEALIELIGHLYLDPSPSFAPNQAQRLADALLEDPEGRAPSIIAAWKTLGRNVTPVLRELYAHDDMTVRTAALEAGAWLQDRRTIDPLIELAQGDDPAMRVRAARWLVSVNGVPRARTTVRAMLNDDDPAIRIGAYEALSMVGDRAIERMAVGSGDSMKFYIDRVDSDKPMVFATQSGTPAIVVFGRDLGFHRNVFSQIGDGLAVRTIPVDTIQTAVSGLYEGETCFVPVHWRGELREVEEQVRTSLGADHDQPLYEAQVGDRDGKTIALRVRGEAALSTLRNDLLNDLPFSQETAGQEPAAIAVVRLTRVPHLVRRSPDDPGTWQGEYVGELLAIREPDTSLPLAVRYRRPGSREAQTYRITPTVATLAYTLGYDRSEHLAKLGPDLPYSTVVQALYQMTEEGLIPAPFEIHLNEVAQLIEDAQQAGEIEERPELDIIEESAPGAPGRPGPSIGPGTTPPAEDTGELTPLTPLDPEPATPADGDDRPE